MLDRGPRPGPWTSGLRAEFWREALGTVLVLFGRVVAKFGVGFALIFGSKIDEKSIQNS